MHERAKRCGGSGLARETRTVATAYWIMEGVRVENWAWHTKVFGAHMILSLKKILRTPLFETASALFLYFLFWELILVLYGRSQTN